jgi:hypothetical protein
MGPPEADAGEGPARIVVKLGSPEADELWASILDLQSRMSDRGPAPEKVPDPCLAPCPCGEWRCHATRDHRFPLHFYPQHPCQKHLTA